MNASGHDVGAALRDAYYRVNAAMTDPELQGRCERCDGFGRIDAWEPLNETAKRLVPLGGGVCPGCDGAGVTRVSS